MIPARTLTAVLFLATAGCISARLSPVESRALRQLTDAVNEQADSGDFSGVVLIARENEPLLEIAHGHADRDRRVAVTPATRFNIASLGKMFTGVAIAQLVERRRAEYDRPIGDYLPELAAAPFARQVTLHHLLTHTSGVPDLPDTLFNQPPAELAGYLPFLSTAALEFAPGSQRAYSNTGFVLAGLIVERLSGESYESYVEREIFRRAGMRDARFDPQGAAAGYSKESGGFAPAAKIAHRGGPHGGSFMTAADLLRFFDALRRGVLAGDEATRTLTTPRAGASSAYGFGTVDVDGDRLIGHSGGDAGASADAYLYWSSGYSIIVLSNLDAPASHKVARRAREIIEPLFASAARKPAP